MIFKPKIMTNGKDYAIIKGFWIFRYAYSPGLRKWYYIYKINNRGSWTGDYEWCKKYLYEAINFNKWREMKSGK